MNSRIFTLLSIVGLFVTGTVYIHVTFATTKELQEVKLEQSDVKYVSCQTALHLMPEDASIKKRCFK
jgi:hypothetical protein